MIKTHGEVRMANDCEDGNGLRCEFLKKSQDEIFLKVQFWLQNRRSVAQMLPQCEFHLNSCLPPP